MIIEQTKQVSSGSSSSYNFITINKSRIICNANYNRCWNIEEPHLCIHFGWKNSRKS